MSKKKKKHLPKPENPQLNRYLLATPFAAVLCVYLIGPLLPDHLSWGFNYWSLVASPIPPLAFAISAILLIPPVANRIAAVLSPSARFLSGLLKRIGRPFSVVLITVIVTLVLFYFRSKAFVYGDGYMILNDTASGEDIVLFGQYYLQILTIYFNHYAFQMLATATELTPAEIFGVMSTLGGTVGAWAVYRISTQLSTDSVTRGFITLGALSSASVILFFGYVENYTWALSIGLWTLSFSIGYVRKQNGVAPLVVFAVLAAFLHMITLPLVLVALLALLLRSGPEGSVVLGIPLRYVSAALAAASIGLVGLAQYFEIEIFVPFAQAADNPYSFLAVDHLSDVINEVALVAPLGLALLILSLLYAGKKAVAVSREDGILATAALVFFLAALWIDPELGAPRDWDLLSFYGLPLTLWGLYRFTKFFPRRKVGRGWLVAAGVVAAMAIVPNIYEKSHAEVAVARLDALLSQDPHYQTTYQNAGRCIPWAVVLQEDLGQWRRSIKYLRRRIDASPDDFNAYYNLGNSYYYLGILDSAYVFLRRGEQLKPDEVKILMNLSHVVEEMGNCSESILWTEKALKLEPTKVSVLTRLGVAQLQCQRLPEALMSFGRAYQIDPEKYDHVVNLGACHAIMGSADSALVYLTRALPMAPADRRSDVYSSLIDVLLDLGRLDEARRYLDALRQINPGSPDIPVFMARLSEALNR